MGLRSWVKKKAKKAKKKVESTAKDTFNKAKKETKKVVNKIEDVAEDSFHHTVKTVGSVDDKVKNLADAAEDLIKRGVSVMDVEKFIKDQMNEIGKDIKREVLDELDKKVIEKAEKALTDQLPKHLEKVFVKELPALITKQGPKIVQNVLDELGDDVTDMAVDIQQSFAKPGFKMGRKMLHGMNTGMSKAEKEKPELISHVNGVGHSFRIGLIKCRYERIFDRMHLLTNLMDQYCDRPPKFCRSEIRDCLMALGPDEVEFTGSISANIVVIGSKIMEYESEFDSISLDLAVYIIDAVLEAAGVPE